MKKKILYFDMDGVLVDYSSGIMQISPEAQKEYQERKSPLAILCPLWIYIAKLGRSVQYCTSSISITFPSPRLLYVS